MGDPDQVEDDFSAYDSILGDEIIPEFGIRMVVGLSQADGEQYCTYTVDGNPDENSVIGLLERTKFRYLLGAALEAPVLGDSDFEEDSEEDEDGS